MGEWHRNPLTTVLDRFLKYVAYDTQSNDASTTYPSTEKQLVLLRELVADLHAAGVADAAMDQHGYVMATLAPSSDNRFAIAAPRLLPWRM